MSSDCQWTVNAALSRNDRKWWTGKRGRKNDFLHFCPSFLTVHLLWSIPVFSLHLKLLSSECSILSEVGGGGGGKPPNSFKGHSWVVRRWDFIFSLPVPTWRLELKMEEDGTRNRKDLSCNHGGRGSQMLMHFGHCSKAAVLHSLCARSSLFRCDICVMSVKESTQCACG